MTFEAKNENWDNEQAIEKLPITLEISEEELTGIKNFMQLALIENSDIYESTDEGFGQWVVKNSTDFNDYIHENLELAVRWKNDRENVLAELIQAEQEGFPNKNNTFPSLH